MLTYREVLDLAEQVSGNKALCPAHPDNRQSLTIDEGEDGKLLLHCFAGCTFEAIIAAFVALKEKSNQQIDSDAGTAYIYRDALGNVVGVKTRLGKHVKPPFAWKLDKGVKAPMYRLDELQHHAEIWAAEGEKDADRLVEEGLSPATTTPNGAGQKITPAHVKSLAAAGVKTINFLYDHDAPGIKAVNTNAAELTKAGIAVRVIPLPGLLASQKDVSDWFDAGHVAQELRDAAGKTPVFVADVNLENAVSKAVPVDPAVIAELTAQAQAILDHPDPLQLIVEAVRKQHFAGDTTPVQISYLAITSRVLALKEGQIPVHLVLLASSSGGKTYVLAITMRFFPAEAVHKMPAGSSRAMVYDPAPIQHKALMVGEIDSIPQTEDENVILSAIRSMLQDHEMSYYVTEKVKGKWTARKVTRKGPTVMITTGTRNFKDHQMATRVFTLEVAEDQEKIRQALVVQAELDESGAPPVDPALIAFQSLIQAKAPWHVAVPFYRPLAVLLGKAQTISPRLQRDASRLISLVKSVAIVRHAHRETDEQGRLVATLEDYQTVLELAGPMYAASVDGCTPGMRRAVEACATALRANGKDWVTKTDIANCMPGIPQRTAYRLITAAVTAEYLEKDEKVSVKQKWQLKLGNPLPAASALPTVAQIVAQMKAELDENGAAQEGPQMTAFEGGDDEEVEV